MSRNKILLMILVDLILLGVSGYWIWDRYQILQGDMRSAQEESASAPVPPQVAAQPVKAAEPAQVAVSTTVVSAPPAAPSAMAAVSPTDTAASQPAQPPAGPNPGKKKKFRRAFVFISTTAKTVQLVGDFNKWKPQALRKGEGGKVAMPAGDYSYNFIVDGKTIRDPNQRRTDAQGRSLLTVAP